MLRLSVELVESLIRRLETRVQGEDPLPGETSGPAVSQAKVSVSEQMVRVPVLGIQFTRLAKVLYGGLDPSSTQLDEPDPAAQVSEVRIWIDRDELPVGLHRLVEASSRQLHIPQIGVGRDRARRRGDGFPKCRRSLVIPPVILQDHPALVRHGSNTITRHDRRNICTPPRHCRSGEQAGDQQYAPRSPR